MAPTPTSSWIPTLIVSILIVLAALGIGVFFYLHDKPSSPPSPLVVAVGDNVTVNYIGVFGSGPEEGKVFDTSIYNVATNPAAWPKGLEYSPRGVESNYSALPVYVGSNPPSSGYSVGNQSYIGVVTGFWQGLVGLMGNETHSIVVPADLGYGPTDEACVTTEPLVQTIPVFASLTVAQFGSTFPGTIANTGAEITDPHFGWPVLILAANSTNVAIENLATVGDTSAPAGWPVVVTNVTSAPAGVGSITIQNELTASDAGHIVGDDFEGTGPCSSQSSGKFIVTNVNVAAGTYTANYNQEVQGQTLIFIVTVVNIHTPAASLAATT
ncbi:MAG: FKBP-type peptidyl-prolyl cis-trans isomerase [Thermoplasmata archaeon]|nr:FKBP-type peptidyl-prolyl cis-trans isomerase [Thermoplasmata archaeon]